MSATHQLGNILEKFFNVCYNVRQKKAKGKKHNYDSNYFYFWSASKPYSL
jgi:hypothetical protein